MSPRLQQQQMSPGLRTEVLGTDRDHRAIAHAHGRFGIADALGGLYLPGRRRGGHMRPAEFMGMLGCGYSTITTSTHALVLKAPARICTARCKRVMLVNGAC